MKNRPSARSVATTYIESTTIHGLSPIYAAGNAALRIFWLTMFASAFGLMSWQIAILVKKLTAHTIVTNVNTRFHPSLPYPAVTLCNMNGFQKSKTTGIIGLIPDNLNETELYKLGQSGEDFLLKGAYPFCDVAGDTCEFPRDFATFSTSNLGNCFTWRSNLTQKKLGSGYGFSKVVNIDIDQYSTISSRLYSGYGAMVVVHSPGDTLTYDGIKNNAIILSPGTFTNIAVKKEQIKRLPDPYPDKCFNQVYFKELLGFKLKKAFRYSTQLCQSMCYMINTYGCGYVPTYLQSIVTRLFSKGETKFLFNYTVPDVCKLKDKCTCPPPCNEDVFSLTVSSSSWPDQLQESDLLSNIRFSNYLKKFHNWNESDIRKNLLALTVYYNDFTVQTVEQTPAYNSNNFLSDLGGQLGLWIGASVYSGFEILSLLFQLIMFLLLSKKTLRVEKAHGEDVETEMQDKENIGDRYQV